MKRILSISKYLFIESLRDKLFIALMLISLIITAGNFALDFYSQGIQDRIIFDFGSSLATLLGAFLVIYLITRHITLELDNKLSYFILTCETSRAHFVIGKWLGSLIFASFNMLIIFLEIFLIIYFNSKSISYLSIIYFYIAFLKLSVLSAIMALFSVSFSAVVAPALGIFFYFIGHFGSYMNFALEKSGNPEFVIKISEFLTAYILPNFKYFTAEHVTTETYEGAAAYLIYLTLYAISINILLSCAAVKIFSRKDI